MMMRNTKAADLYQADSQTNFRAKGFKVFLVTAFLTFFAGSIAIAQSTTEPALTLEELSLASWLDAQEENMRRKHA